jgi:hypothetical protein
MMISLKKISAVIEIVHIIIKYTAKPLAVFFDEQVEEKQVIFTKSKKAKKIKLKSRNFSICV